MLRWWRAEQLVQKHKQSRDFPSQQQRFMSLGPSFPRHSYYLGLAGGDLGRVFFLLCCFPSAHHFHPAPVSQDGTSLTEDHSLL